MGLRYLQAPSLHLYGFKPTHAFLGKDSLVGKALPLTRLCSLCHSFTSLLQNRLDAAPFLPPFASQMVNSLQQGSLLLCAVSFHLARQP